MTDTGRTTVEDDIEALTAEIKVLRADFAKAVELLRNAARHRSTEATKTLIDHMDERPIQTVLAILGAGFLFGVLLSRC